MSIDLMQDRDGEKWTVQQKVALLLISLTLLFDGLDNLSLGLATPAIAREFQAPLSSFGLVFALGLTGVGVGTLVAGPLGDRFGNKRVLMACVLVFGLGTLCAILAASPYQLGILRLAAGLGLGGALPAATALISEITPFRHRTLAVSLAIVAIPLGAVVGSAVAAAFLEEQGWRLLFGLAGALPLLLLPAMAFAIPPVMRTIAPDAIGNDAVSWRILELVRAGRARDSLALGCAFFSVMGSTYLLLNWLPSILSVAGLALHQASRAMLLYNIGGIVASLAVASLIRHFGSRLLVVIGICAIVISLILAFGPPPERLSGTMLLVLIALQGSAITATQTPLFAVAAWSFAPHIKTTGIGAAVCCGRIGAIAASLIGGTLIKSGEGVTAFFLFNAVVLAAACTSLTIFRQHIPPIEGGTAGAA